MYHLILTQLAALENKVDKIPGMGLSEANYTQAEKSKLAAMEDAKFKGLFDTVEQLLEDFPTATPGSYAVVDGGVGDTNKVYMWKVSEWELMLGEAITLTPAQVKALLLENADTNNFGDAEKAKLEAAVTSNALVVLLQDYAEAIHTHAISGVEGLETQLGNKVDKEAGKGLSSNDFTNAAQAAVNGLGTAASRDVASIGTLNTSELMHVGFAGIGAYPSAIVDFNEPSLYLTPSVSAFNMRYTSAFNPINKPPSVSFWWFMKVAGRLTNANSWNYSVLTEDINGNKFTRTVSRNTLTDTITFGDWRRLHDTGSLKKADVTTLESNDTDYMTKKQVMDLLVEKGLL